MKHRFKSLFFLTLLLYASNLYSLGQCGNDFNCNLFLHLTGLTPSSEDLKTIKELIKSNQENGKLKAAKWISDHKKQFQTVLLKEFASSWSDKDGNKGTSLNDTILTVMMVIHKEMDYRKILYENIIAKGMGEPAGDPLKLDKLKLANGDIISAYFYSSNNHYKDLEINERYVIHPPNSESETFVQLDSQTNGTHKNELAAAGILSTNGLGREAYLAGTNRRVLPMMLREASCLSIDSIRDSTGNESKISRDVDRFDSEGSKTTFNEKCKTCHSFMDQVYGAFANYDVPNAGFYPSIQYKDYANNTLPSNHKMLKNVVYVHGHIKKNSYWDVEHLTQKQKDLLGFPEKPIEGFTPRSDEVEFPKNGFGARSLGALWANSESFAKCQPKKAFEGVCRRAILSKDQAFVDSLISEFKTNYNLKTIFLKSAIYCASEV